tara:strand:+ start:614 stop:1336 length:723 start_codon:yes stop_codon:yes gene_type:complete
MNFIVLASGRGSRLNELTKNKPKCLTVVRNKKTILDYITLNFDKSDNAIISTGYKANLIEKHLAGKSINYVRNKNFLNTNMVESLMLCKKKLRNGNLVIIYGDIYFDQKIIKKLKKIKGNVIAVNPNWLHSWKKRYSTLKKIREDAEDLIVSKGKIISIGNRIRKKLPKFQYMGILKIEQKTFNKLEKFYKKINNKKISLTHFIDQTIKAKITTYNYSVFKNYWYEIDNISDLNYLKKNI